MPKVGLEPTPSCEDRILSPLPSRRKNKAPKEVAERPSLPLAQTLARETQIDPDLARLINAWPALPEAIRAGMVAMVKAAYTD